MYERQFTQKTPQPNPQLLQEALGDGHSSWMELIAHVEAEYDGVRQEWKYYSTGGWTLKILAGKRNLFMMIPVAGSLRVAFVFGDRAVAAISESRLPKNIIEIVQNARKFAEGRGLNIPVDDKRDLANVKKLIKIKVEH
jgi:hypothetical protein